MILRVLALNVWSGLDYQGLLRVNAYPGSHRRRYERLVQQLRELQPDVIGLNEANPLPSFARRIARDLGYDQVHHPGLSGVRLGPLRLPTNLCEGEAILARRHLRLRDAGRLQLTGGPVHRHWSFNFGNATQVIRARTEGLDVYCTHWSVAVSAQDYARQEASRGLGTREHRRAQQRRWQEAERTVAFLTGRDRPGVLLGDLNASPDSPEVQLLREAGWTDAVTGPTWDPSRNEHLRRHHPGGPPDRVDYIFLSPQVRLLQARVVLEREPHPSDHFGVLAEVEVFPSDRRNRAPMLDPQFIEAVQKALAQVTTRDVGPITADRPLLDLGLDSVSLAELILVMEDELGVSIDLSAIETLKTFGDLQDLVARLQTQP